LILFLKGCICKNIRFKNTGLEPDEVNARESPILRERAGPKMWFFHPGVLAVHRTLSLSGRIALIVFGEPGADAAPAFRTKSFVPFRTVSLDSPGTPRNLYGFSMNQGIRNLTMRLMNITPDGFSGNTERCCRLFLFKFLQIDEVKYRHLFRKQQDYLILFIRTALWSKTLC
jgi:hypothetical protein